MTKVGSDKGWLLGGGYNLTGYTTEFELSKESAMEETTVLGDTDIAQQAAGFLKTHISQKGFYDDAANASNAAFVSPANSRVVCAGVEGMTVGKKFTGLQSGIQFKYSRQVKVGQLHKAEAEIEASGDVDEGVIHLPLAARTATTNGTAQDGTASSSNGGAGYLQVTDLVASGATFAVTIQDSADGSTGWANILTFTAPTSGPSAQMVEITGTVRRYTRAVITVTGGTTPSITAFVGFARR